MLIRPNGILQSTRNPHIPPLLADLGLGASPEPSSNSYYALAHESHPSPRIAAHNPLHASAYGMYLLWRKLPLTPLATCLSIHSPLTVAPAGLGVPVAVATPRPYHSSPTAEMPRSRHIFGRPLSLSAKYAFAEGWVTSSAHWHAAPCFSNRTRTVAHEKRTIPLYPNMGSTCSRR